MARIAPPRLGTGKGYFIAGWIALGLMLLFSVIAAGGGSGAEALASLCAIVGCGCMAVGFWTKMFAAVERRLIDIQEAMVAQQAPAEPAEPSIITGR